MEEPNDSELESFRQQWRDEVSAKQKSKSTEIKLSNHALTSSSNASKPAAPPRSTTTIPYTPKDDAIDTNPYHDIDECSKHKALEKISSNVTPASALEHYERAVEKEVQGSLGDSLNHYRKAYRMDAQVDRAYRDKHFPAKVNHPNPSSASSTVPSMAQRSLQNSKKDISTSDLIASFSGLAIVPAAPIIEGDVPPPCPISNLPSELLLEVLVWAAIIDPAILSRLSRTSKRFAYLIATETRIWTRLAYGSEFGFASIPYRYLCTVPGTPISSSLKPPSPLSQLSLETYKNDPKHMFRTRPRPRFGGLYIGVTNYTRTGSSAANSVTWNSPMHIVTYYRYLRLYRDGTALSLTTTLEPAEIVPHFHLTQSREALGEAAAQAVQKYGLRGRWRMSGPLGAKISKDLDQPPDPTLSLATDSGIEEEQLEEEEGTLHVETFGSDPKYVFALELRMYSAVPRAGGVKGAQNTKLGWKHFFTYNSLTESWGELSLPHDKGLIWSRVGRYGI